MTFTEMQMAIYEFLRQPNDEGRFERPLETNRPDVSCIRERRLLSPSKSKPLLSPEPFSTGRRNTSAESESLRLVACRTPKPTARATLLPKLWERWLHAHISVEVLLIEGLTVASYHLHPSFKSVHRTSWYLKTARK